MRTHVKRTTTSLAFHQMLEKNSLDRLMRFFKQRITFKKVVKPLSDFETVYLFRHLKILASNTYFLNLIAKISEHLYLLMQRVNRLGDIA